MFERHGYGTVEDILWKRHPGDEVQCSRHLRFLTIWNSCDLLALPMCLVQVVWGDLARTITDETTAARILVVTQTSWNDKFGIGPHLDVLVLPCCASDYFCRPIVKFWVMMWRQLCLKSLFPNQRYLCRGSGGFVREPVIQNHCRQSWLAFQNR